MHRIFSAIYTIIFQASVAAGFMSIVYVLLGNHVNDSLVMSGAVGGAIWGFVLSILGLEYTVDKY